MGQAGHALVSWFTTGSDPVYKATIMPRGSSLGVVRRITHRLVAFLSLLSFTTDVACSRNGSLSAETLRT